MTAGEQRTPLPSVAFSSLPSAKGRRNTALYRKANNSVLFSSTHRKSFQLFDIMVEAATHTALFLVPLPPLLSGCSDTHPRQGQRGYIFELSILCKHSFSILFECSCCSGIYFNTCTSAASIIIVSAKGTALSSRRSDSRQRSRYDFIPIRIFRPVDRAGGAAWFSWEKLSMSPSRF